MRFAAISDIHGNLSALEAVLADIAAQSITDIVNLGDCLSGPLLPAETAGRLMALDLPTVAGNHETALLSVPRPAMNASDAHAFDRMDKHHFDWLAAMPLTLRWREHVFLCHGTPSDNDSNWLERVRPDGSVTLSPRATIASHAEGIGAEVFLCGHTHFARVIDIGAGRLVVNPGSVGLPAFAYDIPVPHVVQSGSPHARYAVLERGAGGWAVTLRQVTYDHMAMARLAEANGRPTWARALATGWVTS